MGKLLTKVLALLLGFIGTMVLSHIPINVMANEDQQIERSVNMTSKKSKKSKPARIYGVQIQISSIISIGLRNIVTIVIPKNQPGNVAPIELGVNIINNTSSVFPFLKYGILTPELVAGDGQILKPQPPNENELRTHSNDLWLIPPGTQRGFPMKAKLCWRNNSLQLSIPAYPNYYWSPQITTENSWNFENLKTATYQLRFIYENPSIEVLSSIYELIQQIELAENIIQKLTTSFVNMRFVEPARDNKNAVTVDGIYFQTILTDRVFNIPKKERGSALEINLGGIHITNKTLNTVLFSFYNSLQPEIVDSDGNIVWRGYFSDWSRQLDESDLVLINPGQEITFSPESAIWWMENEQINLVMATGDGGYHTVKINDLGNYKIQWNYVNQTGVVDVYDPEARNWKKIENIWTGMVTTPFVEFHLTRD